MTDHTKQPPGIKPGGTTRELQIWYDHYRMARTVFLRKLNAFNSQREPRSELAEHLVAAEIDGLLSADRNQPNWDVLGPNGERVQVKTLSNATSNFMTNLIVLPFKGECTHCALLIFGAHWLQTMIIFPRKSLPELRTRFRKRHGNEETELHITQVNLRDVEENPDEFKSLGVQVKIYKPTFRRTIGAG